MTSSSSLPTGWVQPVGSGVLVVGFAAAMSAVLWLAWAVPNAILLIPGGLIAVGVYALAARHPVAHLVAVMLGVIAMLGFDPGLQAREVGYAGYYVAYIWLWLFSRLFWLRRPLLRTALDWVAFGLVIGGTLAAIWGVVQGYDLRIIATDWLAWLFLGLYFPIKEACERHRYGFHAALAAYACVLLYVSVRNGFYAVERFGSVSYAYEISRGRVVQNDSMTYAAAVLSFVFLILARSWRELLGWLVAAGIFLGGLILTQGRGFWLAFILAALSIFVVVPTRYRVRWVTLAVTAFVTLFTVGYLLFADLFLLFASGILDRFLSIGSATQADISLINRFYESDAVREEGMRSPIFGVGIGATYVFYDLIVQSTPTDNFSHNGYLSLWFRFGFFGLLGMLFYWARSAWYSLQAFRDRERPHLERVAGLFLGAALFGYVLSAYTSNPFMLTDTLYQFGIFGGLSAGLAARRSNVLSPS